MFETKQIAPQPLFAVAKGDARWASHSRAVGALVRLCGACIDRAGSRNTDLQGFIRPMVQTVLRRDGTREQVASEAVEVDRPRSIPRRMPAEVVSLDRPTSKIAVLTLRVAASQLFTHNPGQYVRILDQRGVNRAFSIASASRNNGTFVLHVRCGRDGSNIDGFHRGMGVGDVIQIGTARGSSLTLGENERPLIGIVGGTGYAPMQAVLEDWAIRRVRRQVHLYWGNRLPSGFYAMRTAIQLVRRFPGSTFTPVVSSGNPADAWRGRRGLVHWAALSDFPDLRNADVLVCGAGGLIDAARRDCLAGGLVADRFHVDAYSLFQSSVAWRTQGHDA
jgi:CDP-4-dehydro-6-deoxyglucose reductase, E3